MELMRNQDLQAELAAIAAQVSFDWIVRASDGLGRGAERNAPQSAALALPGWLLQLDRNLALPQHFFDAPEVAGIQKISTSSQQIGSDFYCFSPARVVRFRHESLVILFQEISSRIIFRARAFCVPSRECSVAH